MSNCKWHRSSSKAVGVGAGAGSVVRGVSVGVGAGNVVRGASAESIVRDLLVLVQEGLFVVC